MTRPGMKDITMPVTAQRPTMDNAAISRVYQVTPIEDGESYVVRGTTDVRVARRALLLWLLDMQQEGPRSAIEYRDYLQRRYRRAGLFRWNPCHPRSCWPGNHCGHLAEVDGPGRGVWQGVWFG